MAVPKDPVRVLSWQQQVLEADPEWQRDNQRPWVYEFSNGRRFIDALPLYTGTSTA